MTGYIYRNAHNAFFNNIDKYFSPFIVANQSESFKTRELNDILPENNQGLVLIPQLLTNNAKDFYKNKPNLKIFKEALILSKNPVCYNGDIFTIKDYKEFSADFPSVDTLMFGRGLLANPGLINDITNNIKLEKNY